MMQVDVIIDGREIAAQAGQTILEAAQAAGIDIPTLCHHPALEPTGACRMCLVEVGKQRTLQPACTFQVTSGMVVHTQSDKVIEARRFVLQLLLSERNHYCMYCQMSGDCELQKLAYEYGLDSWLYPRAYPILPVDATQQYFVMDHGRCILCRRCVRACSELVGNYTLGVGGRGTNTMIVADMSAPLGDSSCISCGTCLQVCPTGARMDRRSAYRGREAEVERIRSTCAACSIGCGIELVTRDNQLLRIEGDWEAEVNQGLLCVAGRFDPLADTRRRVLTPMVRHNGDLQPATWEDTLGVVTDRLRALDGASLAALISPRATNETLALFAKLFKGLGVRNVSSLKPVPGFLVDTEGELAVLDEASFYLVVGEDLSIDHQVAGFAIRRGVMNRGARLAIVGEDENGMADIAHYRFGPDEIGQAITLVKGAEAPVVVYGARAGDLISVLKDTLSDEAQFVGLVPGSNSRGALAARVNGTFEFDGVKCAFALVADDEVDDTLLSELEEAEFIVVQASYWSTLVERADVVLPTTIWAEKSGTFANTEGRTVPMQAALRPPMGVKDDQEILEALVQRMG